MLTVQNPRTRLVKINDTENVHYSFKIAINFVKINEMKKKFNQIKHQALPKKRKEKQSGALQFFEVNKLSKDVGVWHLN